MSLVYRLLEVATMQSGEADLQPLVAQAVAIGFTGLRLTDMYNDMSQSLDRMDPSDVRFCLLRCRS